MLIYTYKLTHFYSIKPEILIHAINLLSKLEQKNDLSLMSEKVD